jgi:transcriptional regulator GlxA family with amidase domain
MNFGFLLFPDVEELDFIGPWEIIGMWSKYFNGPERRLLISQGGGAIQCAKGLIIPTHCSFTECPPLDYLLIPGGQGTRKEVDNHALLDFVRRQALVCQQVLSVCTGAFILQAAGLLTNKHATTHWGSLDRLRQFSNVTVVEERFVHDGNIWTAAGVSAGIDLALALIADVAGDETAGKVQMSAEYYPSSKRYGSAHLSPDSPGYLRK